MLVGERSASVLACPFFTIERVLDSGNVMLHEKLAATASDSRSVGYPRRFCEIAVWRWGWLFNQGMLFIHASAELPILRAARKSRSSQLQPAWRFHLG